MSPIRPNALFGGGDGKEGGGLGGLGNMSNIMENMKKAQSLVQTEAAKVQEELAQCASNILFPACLVEQVSRSRSSVWARLGQPCDWQTNISLFLKNLAAKLCLYMNTVWSKFFGVTNRSCGNSTGDDQTVHAVDIQFIAVVLIFFLVFNMMHRDLWS